MAASSLPVISCSGWYSCLYVPRRTKYWFIEKTLIFGDEKFENVCDDLTKNSLCEIIAETHDFVDDVCSEYYNAYRRVAFVTPGTYLSFISAFKTVYLSKMC